MYDGVIFIAYKIVSTICQTVYTVNIYRLNIQSTTFYKPTTERFYAWEGGRHDTAYFTIDRLINK